MSNNNNFSQNETDKSKKKQNFFLKGINNCFFNKNKTISKTKNKEKVFVKSNSHKRQNILFKDIILKCLQNLDLESLGQARQTCKEWKALIENNEQIIWRQLCKRYWGLDHKKYTNNRSYNIYEVRWKEIFLLNYNMQHEKYYFTSHHQPFQLGQAQKQSRFNQTYLNINPYAFKSSTFSQLSSYYPFPYPSPKNNNTHVKKEKAILPNHGLVTPLASSSSSSTSSSSSPESSSNKIQNSSEQNNYYTNDIPSSSSFSSKENENDISASSSSLIESPSSPLSSSSQVFNSSLTETIENSTSTFLDLMDDDNELSNSSSSYSHSNEHSSISSYLSKLPFINKLSNAISHSHSTKKYNKRKYLMIWPYGRSEPYTVSICGHYLFWIYNFREIQVYDIETKRYIRRLKGHDEEIGLVLSNHRHYIVSFDLNSEIIVWDIRNFSIKRRFNVRDSLGLIISMSVHKDRMVATNNKGLIMVWNINTGDLITSYKIPREFINPNEEENYTNVALWNDYIAFALQCSVYFIYDISKNKCINIMYHPQNQKAQELFHLIRQRISSSSSYLRRNENNDDDDEDIDSNASDINQILNMINHRQEFLEEEEIDNYIALNNHNHSHIPHQSHPILEAETQEMMMPNPNNSNDAYTDDNDEQNQDNDSDHEERIINLNQLLEENPVADDEIIENEFMPPQIQYPFTLAINSHVLLTNGSEKNTLSLWSLKTGELLYNLSESRALEKLDLHLPALRMVDLANEISFAEFSTDYSFIYTTIQYEEESSLAVWDFRSDQYPQKSRFFDIIDLNIEEQHRQFWIGYEEEDDDDD